MLDAKKLAKVVSVAVASMSLLGVSASVTEAASFTAKDVKKTNGKKLVKISGNQWLDTKDVVKD